jgi:hypothetical protein
MAMIEETRTSNSSGQLSVVSCQLPRSVVDDRLWAFIRAFEASIAPRRMK